MCKYIHVLILYLTNVHLSKHPLVMYHQQVNQLHNKIHVSTDFWMNSGFQHWHVLKPAFSKALHGITDILLPYKYKILEVIKKAVYFSIMFKEHKQDETPSYELSILYAKIWKLEFISIFFYSPSVMIFHYNTTHTIWSHLGQLYFHKKYEAKFEV